MTTVQKRTYQERLEDGSITIAFGDTDVDIPQEYVCDLVAQFVHETLHHEQYSTLTFLVCIGDEGDVTIPEAVKWCVPDEGMHAIPFWIRACTCHGVTYATRKYGLKPLRDGKPALDIVEHLSSFLSSGGMRCAVQKHAVAVMPPVVFDAEVLQKFFCACASEMKQYGKEHLTDAALCRIYQSIDADIDDKNTKSHIAQLIERGFFARAVGAPHQYTLSAQADQYLYQGVETSSTAATSHINETLAKATLKIRTLKAKLEEAEARADAAERKAAETAAALKRAEAKLAQQPDIDALVQAELVRLLEEE